jgi:alpha-galactosidase
MRWQSGALRLSWQAGRLLLNYGALAGALDFGVTVDGVRYDSSALRFEALEQHAEGALRLTFCYRGALEVRHQLTLYDDSGLIELSQELSNPHRAPLRLTRLDSLALRLDGRFQLDYFTGDWGCEFSGHSAALSGPLVLESRSGRSSKGHHPHATLQAAAGVCALAVAWSGNWVLRFAPEADGVSVSGGLHDWAFEALLAPGETLVTPSVMLAFGDSSEAAAQAFARVGRRYWYPRREADWPPVEWNPWWPYEDHQISAEAFLSHLPLAAGLGVEACVLDAGWFGPSSRESFWVDYRGDWRQVNRARFPEGLRPLSQVVRGRGMRFGLWCEIEALGPKAELARLRPELIAQRDGAPLGYLCLGSPAAQAWALATLCELVERHGLDWLKLDFNLDPGAGCNRSDHGHGAGDGLYAHYRGYYALLTALRARYPQLILEGCSSGGLRIDLGLARHVDMVYLSDPDWPAHSLQVFWGASTLLAPERLLHWSFSDWINRNPPPEQTFNPHDPALTPVRFDYYTRISMLGAFGISQKLAELPAWLQARLAEHIRLYRSVVRRFVAHGDLYRLTEQPRRDGSGERWAAFQYSLADAQLLFVFRLPGGAPQRHIRLRNLNPARSYQLEGFDGVSFAPHSGAALMDEGLRCELPEEGSWLVRLG